MIGLGGTVVKRKNLVACRQTMQVLNFHDEYSSRESDTGFVHHWPRFNASFNDIASYLRQTEAYTSSAHELRNHG
jgi:hypothetical protein